MKALLKSIVLFALSSSLIFLNSCKDTKQKLFEQIKALEQSDSLGKPATLAAMAKLHTEYGLKYKDSLANTYLYAAAMYHYYGNRPEESKKLLGEFLHRSDSSDRRRNALLSLAQMHAAIGSYDTAEVLITEAVNNYLPNNNQWNDLLKLYQNKLVKIPAEALDFERMSLAYTALGAFPEALEQLDTAIRTFPDYPQRANLIYRCGFVAWEYLKDAEKAREYYRFFLSEYPEHPQAVEVENILNSGMLDMTDEQILDMLRGKAS